MVPYLGGGLFATLRRGFVVITPHNYCHSNPNKQQLVAQAFRNQIWELFSQGSSLSNWRTNRLANDWATTLWRRLKEGCNEKLVLLGEILTTQCHFYASQRLWRASQVWSLYTKIYSERCFQQMMRRFIGRLRNGRRPRLGILLGASSLFCWETGKITDDEIRCCVDELDQFEEASPYGANKFILSPDIPLAKRLAEDGWEPVISREHFNVWRKAVPGTSLCEYKVFGTFSDIPARVFFNVQLDIEYRKIWDHLVIELKVIDREDREDGCEVIHWVMHYPFPMYSRDYVYIRRAVVDVTRNAMILVSRAVEHPACPESDEYVRVSDYSSRMVIRPHKSFDENGFDYLLTYFDDPRAAFPAPAYNWMASAGVPDFVQKLHSAACELHYGNRAKQQQQQAYSQSSSPAPCATSPASSSSSSSSSSQCIYA